MVLSERKQDYFERLLGLLQNHETIFVVGADNVSSLQMQQVRAALRGKAVVLMGKNTMVRKAIKSNPEKVPNAAKLLPFIKGNVGFVFVDKKANIAEVRQIMTSNKRAAAARPGAVSPVNVVVPAGNTGQEPTKTSFFQALNIPTKITKGTVEIVSDQLVLKAGDRVGNSEAALLAMLKVMPFNYGLEIEVVYENGSMYSPEVLDLTEEDYKGFFTAAASKVAAIGLATQIPSELTLPFSLRAGFKNCLSVAFELDYPMKEAEALKAGAAAAASAPAAAAPAAAAAAPAKGGAAAKAKEPEPEEEEDMGMSLFD